MTLGTVLLLVAIGLGIGFISGIVGIGGGVLVIPVLIYIFHFTQAQANGTSLAMLLPPIGIFAVVAYWRAGHVRLDFAGWLAVGFAFGAYGGARLVSSGWLNGGIIRILFAMLLLYIAARILIKPGGRVGVLLELYVITAAFGISYVLVRLVGGKWRKHPPAWLSSTAAPEAFSSTDFEI
jgi:uncharacterized membrane protein YfcA